LRELREETGLLPDQIEIEEGFVYTETYYPTYKRFGNEKVEKTVNIYLGHLKTPDTNVIIHHLLH
jgi:8-oxo-dGTP pyrophosphatase MutT (NUDIX family)